MKIMITFLTGLLVSSLSLACEVPSAQSIVRAFHQQGFADYTVDTDIENDFGAVNEAYTMATWEFRARLPKVSPDEVYAAMPTSCMTLSSGAVPQTAYRSTPRCFGAAFAMIAKKHGCTVR